MKKILFVLLVLMLAVFITGCGDEPKQGNTDMTDISADPEPAVTVEDETLTDQMLEFDAYDKVPDAAFCGDWTCFTPDSSGEEAAMLLTLEPEGYASYSYGYGNSEVLEQFEGYWELNDDDILTLYMTGGPEAGMEPHDLIGKFEWEITAEGLTLSHISGGALLYGTDGGTFEFVSNEY